MLAQAADDPDGLAIKETLYRTGVGSPIIAALLRAAERNNQVTVLRVQAFLREQAHRLLALARDRAGVSLRPERAQAAIGMSHRRTARLSGP